MYTFREGFINEVYAFLDLWDRCQFFCSRRHNFWTALVQKPPSGNERFYQTDESNLNRQKRGWILRERENCFRASWIYIISIFWSFVAKTWIFLWTEVKKSSCEVLGIFKEKSDLKNSSKIHPINFMSFSALKLDQRMLSLDPTAAANIKRWAFNLLRQHGGCKKEKGSRRKFFLYHLITCFI